MRFIKLSYSTKTACRFCASKNRFPTAIFPDFPAKKYFPETLAYYLYCR